MLEIRNAAATDRDATSSIVDLLVLEWNKEHSLRLTVDGLGHLEIRDADSFRALVALAERLETIEALRPGIESLEQGEGRPASEVFDSLRNKHGLAN